MENRYSEELIAVIVQLRAQQEINTDKLDNQLGAIAGQLERIGNYIGFHLDNLARGEHETFKGQS